MQNTELRDTEDTPNRIHNCLLAYHTIYALLPQSWLFPWNDKNIEQQGIHRLSVPGITAQAGKPGIYLRK